MTIHRNTVTCAMSYLTIVLKQKQENVFLKHIVEISAYIIQRESQ